MSRPQLLLKSRIVNGTIWLLESHKTVMLMNAYKVKASTINEARKRLRGRAVLKHVKTTLLQKAAEKTRYEKLKEFLKKNASKGSITLILSNEDPYELQQELKKYAVKLPLSAGDIVDREVVVPAGNTGLPAGPVISSLNEVGLPTRIETGSIWITRDTVVAKPGDVITPQLAAVLSKLNIRPVEAYVKSYAAFHEGTVFTEDILSKTPEDILKEVSTGFENMLRVAIATFFPTPETLGIMLSQAFTKAVVLGVRTEYYDENTLKMMLQAAKASAGLLESMLEKA
ncbi:MAG: 50S ribosomal protein L10 [Thermoproteota archaeon]